MHGLERAVVGHRQNVAMPTLREMHQKTAASPRSTAKLFLLLEELSYRHLYRVDRAGLGNFRIAPAVAKAAHDSGVALRPIEWGPPT